MRILIDTNVMLDYLAERPGYHDAADAIMEMCRTGEVKGFVAAHSITNAYYVLRKFYTEAEWRTLLLKYLKLATIVGIDENKIKSSIIRDQFDDLEDCLQDEYAVECDAKYIVTRNMDDFRDGAVKAISPNDFLETIMNRSTVD